MVLYLCISEKIFKNQIVSDIYGQKFVASIFGLLFSIPVFGPQLYQ